MDFIYFHNSEKEAKANVLNTDNVLISFFSSWMSFEGNLNTSLSKSAIF